jgi:hypothetical protein
MVVGGGGWGLNSEPSDFTARLIYYVYIYSFGYVYSYIDIFIYIQIYIKISIDRKLEDEYSNINIPVRELCWLLTG